MTDVKTMGAGEKEKESREDTRSHQEQIRRVGDDTEIVKGR